MYFFSLEKKKKNRNAQGSAAYTRCFIPFLVVIDSIPFYYFIFSCMYIMLCRVSMCVHVCECVHEFLTVIVEFVSFEKIIEKSETMHFIYSIDHHCINIIIITVIIIVRFDFIFEQWKWRVQLPFFILFHFRFCFCFAFICHSYPLTLTAASHASIWIYMDNVYNIGALNNLTSLLFDSIIILLSGAHSSNNNFRVKW